MTTTNESLRSNKKQEVSEEDDNMMTRILISVGSVIFILIAVIIIFIVCRKRNKKNQNSVNASDDDKNLRSNRVSDISANVGLMDPQVENEDFENSAALNIKHSRRISVNKEDGEGDGTPPTHVNSVD